jgi:hypothetical protein
MVAYVAPQEKARWRLTASVRSTLPSGYTTT